MNKKTRNRLLALGCLLVFLALGALFYINWVVQRPFAVIVFLADNLTPSVLTPARNYQGGADHRLQLEQLPNFALLATHANDFAVADAAAAASSIATGQKGNNGVLGVNQGKGALCLLSYRESFVANVRLPQCKPASLGFESILR